jgi:hypothetical protein
MMKNKLFTEKQYFKGKDLVVAVSVLIVLLSYQFIQDVFFAHQQSFLANGLCLIVIVALGWWIKSLYDRQQKTVVTDKKIICKVDSWYKQKKKIPLKDIEGCAVVRTSTAAQWQGVNIESPREEMWSINGRNGLSIETKDGRSIFIGSSKPQEMAQVIKKAMR